VRLEWDEAKRAANITKHGYDFADAVHVLSGDLLEIEDLREDYSEMRILAFGMLGASVAVVFYTPREEDLFRIISFRKATLNEEKSYYEYLF
jgi:uncharacterized protein